MKQKLLLVLLMLFAWAGGALAQTSLPLSGSWNQKNSSTLSHGDLFSSTESTAASAIKRNFCEASVTTGLYWGIGQNKSSDDSDVDLLSENSFKMTSRPGLSGEYVAQVYILSEAIKALHVTFRIESPSHQIKFAIWGYNSEKGTAQRLTSTSSTTDADQEFNINYLTYSANDRIILVWGSSNAPGGTATTISNFAASYEAQTDPMRDITYTLRDANGNTTTGTYQAYWYGEHTLLPEELPGVLDYTITDATFSGDSYSMTGNINYPFPINKNVRIAGTVTSGLRYWKANKVNETDYNLVSCSETTNDPTELDPTLWKVVPDYSGSNISFKFLSKSTNKYIKAAGNTKGSTISLVDDVDEASTFTYGVGTSNTTRGFMIADGLYLSVASSTTNTAMNIWNTVGASGTHTGGNVTIENTEEELAALLEQLENAYNAAETYQAAESVGTGVNQYTQSEAYLQAPGIIAGTSYATIPKIREYVNNINNTHGWTINQPTTGLYRFKNYFRTLNHGVYGDYYYISNTNTSSTHDRVTRCEQTNDANSADAIYYYDATAKTLMAYNNGYYLGQNTVEMHAVGETPVQWAFSEGVNVGTYTMTATTSTNRSKILYGWSNVSISGNNRVYVDRNGSKANDGHTDWILEPVTELPITIGSTGYATFSSPVKVTAPVEVTVSTIKAVSGGNAQLTNETEAIPANAGVIIQGTADTPITFTVASEDATAFDNEGNKLVACVAAANITKDANTFVLAYGSKGAGFYNIDADGVLTGHKAYLNNAGEARAFIGFGDTETGINNIETAASPLCKDGKYIIDGKILIVKSGVKYNTIGQEIK